jgi:Txe/YoeB family toxin of toxin-antitoxin system
VVRWRVVLSTQAARDARKLHRSGLRRQAERLLDVLREDPFRQPPRFEKLVGNLSGFYSRRINLQHRLVYRVDADAKLVHVLRMWTHYE